MVAITHPFVSAVADDPAAVLAGQVVPSKWNENHTITMAATARVVGRKTSGAGAAEEISISELLDFVGSAAQGDILYRNASAWVRLGAGTAGQVLQTGGAGANPSWLTVGGMADPGANGLMVRTALNTTTARSIIAGTNISITNGDGVSGNPTINFTGTLPVANGGTGAASLTANRVLLGNGTSALQEVAPGTSGNVLTSNGTTWASTAPSAVPTSASTAEIAAQTAVDKFIRPDGLKNSPLVPKAVAEIENAGSSGTLTYGINISSISDIGGGAQINFITAMSGTNYFAMVELRDQSSNGYLAPTIVKATGNIQISNTTGARKIRVIIFEG